MRDYSLMLSTVTYLARLRRRYDDDDYYHYYYYDDDYKGTNKNCA